MNDPKNLFIKLLQSTNRPGINHVIIKLEELGFFTAPSSSKFHGNYDGGLLEHSINVARVGVMLLEQMSKITPELAQNVTRENILIACLLHDVCKAEVYEKGFKWAKDENNKWIQEPCYNVNYDNFPVGHGEKSVIQLLRWGLELTNAEILAIRWHMHAWDLAFQSPEAKNNLNAAKQSCPLLCLLQAADGLASSLMEKTV